MYGDGDGDGVANSERARLQYDTCGPMFSRSYPQPLRNMVWAVGCFLHHLGVNDEDRNRICIFICTVFEPCLASLAWLTLQSFIAATAVAGVLHACTARLGKLVAMDSDRYRRAERGEENNSCSFLSAV